MLTADQVTALAPDAASFKAGQGLATPRKWTLLGSDADCLWGLAQGSGKNPYQVCVELGEFATKCSCPSRKFPCKHALGLLFLAAADPAAFSSRERPPWLSEWLESRQARKDKAGERAAESDGKPKDEAAAAKRREKRAARMVGGIDLLEQFLLDLARNGLGQPEVSDPDTWSALARRLVDAQTPGLAGWVRRIGELPHAGPNWERVLLHELGNLHLLVVAYRQRDNFEPDLRSEIEQLVGWTVEKDELLKQPGVSDRWFVAARRITEQDRLVTSATWLHGLASRRWALVLRFAALPARPAEPWPLGSIVETELVYYPGVQPDRALPRNEAAAARTGEAPPVPEGGFQDLLDGYAATLAGNPWRARRPFLVAAQPSRHRDQPVLVDSGGLALPWLPAGDEEPLLAGLCGGRPVPLCGEWNGRSLSLLSACDADSWFPLRTVPA